MKGKPFLKWLLAIVVLAGAAFPIVWMFVEAGSKGDQEQEIEAVSPSAVHVTTEGGRIVITISEAEQARNGISTIQLKSVTHQEEIKAYGTVLDLADLIDMHNSYAAAKAKVDESGANLVASKKEYERLNKLYKQDRNVSDKSLQAAEATWRSDEAAAEASRVALQAQENVIVQQWGKVIAEWLFESAPAFERLAGQQDLLLQLTPPPNSEILSLPRLALVTASGRKIQAKLISPAPRTDPRIQGISYFYLAPREESRLLPQMNIYGYLPVGREASGVIVPTSAVVWLEGSAWIYVQESPEQFVRREIPTDVPVEEGWFVTKTVAPGDRIVTAGAQLLLSEEFRSRIQVQG